VRVTELRTLATGTVPRRHREKNPESPGTRRYLDRMAMLTDGRDQAAIEQLPTARSATPTSC
jgi:hypothetical protein